MSAWLSALPTISTPTCLLTNWEACTPGGGLYLHKLAGFLPGRRFISSSPLTYFIRSYMQLCTGAYFMLWVIIHCFIIYVVDHIMPLFFTESFPCFPVSHSPASMRLSLAFWCFFFSPGPSCIVPAIFPKHYWVILLKEKSSICPLPSAVSNPILIAHTLHFVNIPVIPQEIEFCLTNRLR